MKIDKSDKRNLNLPEFSDNVGNKSTDICNRQDHSSDRSRQGHPGDHPTVHSIGRVIRKYRKAAGLTQGELAVKTGTHKNTILAWEKDIQKPSLEKTMDLCLILHMPIEELTGIYEGRKNGEIGPLSDTLENDLTSFYEKLSDPYRRMLVGIAETMASQQQEERDRMLRDQVTFFEHSVTRAAAGTGDAYGDIPVDYCFIRSDPRYTGADVIVTVDGHSMEPWYRDGVSVYVRLTQDVPDGHDVICRSNDGQLIKRKEGNILVSLNPDPRYDLHKSPDDHVEIIGEVLGIVNPDDFMDPAMYPRLEEIHAEEVRKFNRRHNTEV